MLKASRYLLLQILILGSFPVYAQNENSVNCETVNIALETYLKNSPNISQSLDVILGNKGVASVAVEDLFQIDLKNQELIDKRIETLSKLMDQNNILESDEFKKYISCAKNKKSKSEINSLALNQVQINSKKIEFLKKEIDDRKALIEVYKSQINHIENKNLLNKELSITQDALKLAQDNIKNSKLYTATQEKNGDHEKIINSTNDLEAILVDIESKHIEFIQNLVEKSDYIAKLQDKLSNLAGEVDSKDVTKVSQNLSDISEIWRASADWLLEFYSGIEISSDIRIPDKLEITPVSEDDKKLFSDYQKLYNKVLTRRSGIIDARINLINKIKTRTFQLLTNAGTLRVRLLKQCDAVKCVCPAKFSNQNFSDITKEVKVIPLKFISANLVKLLEIKTKFNSGIEGWMDLIRQFFMLIMLLATPLFFIKFLTFLSDKLNNLRKEILERSIMSYKYRTAIALWITRLNPFIPSIGMICTIEVAIFILNKTDLSQVAKILPYLQIYFFYKVAKIIFGIILEDTVGSDFVSQNSKQKEKINNSASLISKIIFIEYVILGIVEDATRKALVYNLLISIIFWFNLLMFFLEVNKWKNEIINSFSKTFPIPWKKIRFIFKTKFAVLFYPILLFSIIVNSALKALIHNLGRFDATKQILSNILRKKLERVEQKTSTKLAIPATYAKVFDYYLPAEKEIFVEQERSVLQDIIFDVESWLNDKSPDNLLVVSGNRGMGKTTTLSQLKERINNDVSTIFTKVPTRILSSAEFCLWLSDLTKHSITSNKDYTDFDRSLTKKIVFCVDDIQNFFIATIGGFNAYRNFIEILNLKTSNIFWCLSVNSRSWDYLKGIFGKEHFCGKIIKLRQWKDLEIQKLILARHKSTGLSFSFDKLIKAYGARNTPGEQIEVQFFRLLWGQSRGNPRSALMYWMSAISYLGDSNIYVGVPSFVNTSIVAKMSDDALFILSAITRHENLTYEELNLITEIEPGIIYKCVKEATDKELVWVDNQQRIRISSRSQYVIDYFLIGKNFLYE